LRQYRKLAAVMCLIPLLVAPTFGATITASVELGGMFREYISEGNYSISVQEEYKVQDYYSGNWDTFGTNYSGFTGTAEFTYGQFESAVVGFATSVIGAWAGQAIGSAIGAALSSVFGGISLPLFAGTGGYVGSVWGRDAGVW